MERRSDKHNPRVDDELSRESRGIGQGVTPVVPPGRTDAEARSELARRIEGSAFPGEREELIASATRMQAPDEVIRVLERLPADRAFENLQDVWEALGGEPERRAG